MAIQITPEVRGFLKGLVGMDDTTKGGILQFYANSNSMSMEDLLEAASEVEKSAAKSIEAERKKDARKAQKAKDEEVRAAILACSTAAEVRAYLDYVESRKKRVWVTAQGFDTNLRASRQGNTSGQGRPKADAPTGFQNAETGEEILGGISTFVKAQVEADNFSAELLEALYTDGGNLRQKDKLVAALLEADVIEAVETDSEDSDDNESDD